MAYLIYKELESLLKNNEIELSVEKAIEQIKKMHEIKIPTQSGTCNTFGPKNNYWQELICSLFSRFVILGVFRTKQEKGIVTKKIIKVH